MIAQTQIGELPGLVAPLVAVMAATLIALWLLNRLAFRLGWLDAPDALRKRHGRAVPLTGGMALVAGLLAARFALDWGPGEDRLLVLLAAIALLHMIDDLYEIGAVLRLALDAAFALLLIAYAGGAIETMGQLGPVGLELGVLAVPMTVLSFLTLSNAFNMIDGADGLLLSQFLIAAGGLMAWLALSGGAMPSPVLVGAGAAALVLLAANLGWLGAGFRCFAGDSGARMLGFLMVAVLIAPGPAVISQIEGVFLVALPLLDICAVTVERLRARQRPSVGDRRHLHHLLLDAGLSPGEAVAGMAAISLGFVAVALAIATAGLGAGVGFAIFAALAVGYWSLRRPLVTVLALRRATAGSMAVTPAE